MLVASPAGAPRSRGGLLPGSMRRTFFIATIAILVFVRAPARAADLVLDRLLLDRFTDFLESLRVQAGIPGLAGAIVGTNDKLWEHAFGNQDVERAMPTSISPPTDTPFHVDGLTEVFTASLVLRCAEEGRLSLDDTIGQFKSDSPDANATIRQILTHTSGSPSSLVYAYRPARLASLTPAINACAGESFREALAKLLDRLNMVESVPGPDAVLPASSGPALDRYTRVLARLATPYAVDQKGHASPSQYVAKTLTPTSGLISTVWDLEQFTFALNKGSLILRPETILAAWRAPSGPDGQRLPHGCGWFVQTYFGETIAWQFGVGENASSSLMVTVPGRGLTLILLANSDGLVRPFPLSAGNLTASPFGRVFLELFAK